MNNDKAKAFLSTIGVAAQFVQTVIDAAEGNDIAKKDMALYAVVSDWNNFQYGPDINEEDFPKLMKFLRTGEFAEVIPG